MVNQNKDSLRTQIIDSMRRFVDDAPRCSMDGLFDHAVMPVLEAAMKAGELLLHRATTPQPPIHQHIVDWLESCCAVITKVHAEEETVSRRELLHLLYQLEQGAIVAVADARAINSETTIGALGNLLAGQSLPAKG